MVQKYSYFQDFTEEERQMVLDKMEQEHQSWKEIIRRFGHPKEWEENKPKQLEMFK